MRKFTRRVSLLLIPPFFRDPMHFRFIFTLKKRTYMFIFRQ